MGGKGSGRKKGTGGVPYEHNPMLQAADITNVDPEINDKAIRLTLWLATLETPDYGDPEAIAQRYEEYALKCAETGCKMTVAGMANAWGMDRDTLSKIVGDHPGYRNWHGGVLSSQAREVMKKAHSLMNSYTETSMVNGGINPVVGIFQLKNHHGYTDRTEHYNVNVNARPQLESADDAVAKYSKMVGKAPDSLPQAEIESIEDVE